VQYFLKRVLQIGIKVEGVELSATTSESSAHAVHTHEAGASVVLIGMRGTGKTFVGNMAASALSWICLDADNYFEEKHQTGLREFVHQHGWEAFRDAETAVLRELLTEKALGHIISLGGGIVETPAARDLLKQYAAIKGPVVHVVRPLSDIISYLNEETARPAYGEPVSDVFHRRDPWFAECSNYIFDNQFGTESSSAGTFNEMSRFFKHVTGQQPNLAANLRPDSRSYFLSLTYPDITQALSYIEELTEGVDALELRVDLLRSPKDYEKLGHSIPPLAYIQQQVASLRRVSSLPIVFTVRTKSQGGAFPDAAIKESVDLLRLALQLGVEYIDVETTLPEEDIKSVAARKGYSQVIASWHDWSGDLKWDGPMVKEKYELASRLGDIVKIVGKASSIKDNFSLYEFVSSVSSNPGAKPIIAINMGVEGQMSRILNSTFSPVSHPLLPNKAAPGQLSFRQIQQALHLLGLVPSLRFYLFGNPISQSMSPTLHNTGFDILGLPHKYELLETENVGEEIKIAITDPNFGGASVTIPFKLDIIPLLDKLTPAAEAIGAVNTIVPQQTSDGTGRILLGDNTDWIGIKASIQLKLGSRAIRTALVIGAGGTARAAIYALHALDAQIIYLYNRTASKAQELAGAFPEARIKVIDQIEQWSDGLSPPNVIVSTVPASATSTEEITNNTMNLTTALFGYRDGPAVVVDMAYRPAQTPLLRVASAAGGNWATVRGVDVLLEQGYEQFKTWTGRVCPKDRVAKQVYQKYDASA